MSRRSHTPKISINTSPWAIIVGALILGSAYFGVEVYEYHHSYHDKEGIWQVCFTPNQKCQKLILKQIKEAKQSILIQGYGFTDPDIMDALIQAKRRNVKVRILLDYSNLTAKNSGLSKMVSHHIPVRIDKPQGIAHNKVMIFDNHILLVGSYNFSQSAYSRNAENVLIVHDKILVAEYTQNWNNRWDLSSLPSKIKYSK